MLFTYSKACCSWRLYFLDLRSGRTLQTAVIWCWWSISTMCNFQPVLWRHSTRTSDNYLGWKGTVLACEVPPLYQWYQADDQEIFAVRGCCGLFKISSRLELLHLQMHPLQHQFLDFPVAYNTVHQNVDRKTHGRVTFIKSQVFNTVIFPQMRRMVCPNSTRKKWVHRCEPEEFVDGQHFLVFVIWLFNPNTKWFEEKKLPGKKDQAVKRVWNKNTNNKNNPRR